jgi:prophage antirepressor-like protein
MNNLITQTFHNTTVRVVTIDDAPWFVAADVCRALGLPVENGTTMHVSKLRPDEKRKIRVGDMTPSQDLGTPSGGLNASTTFVIVSESGLYKLIMRSNKPEAREFQNWLTRIVLPAIRKHGGYIVGEEKLATGEMTKDELISRAMQMAKEILDESARRDSAPGFGDPLRLTNDDPRLTNDRARGR